ncbi:lipopolysaccharide biosynthesis protein [Bifidobacterium choloepi]|uniref:Lipopolysaccharide biosynthesis protein n=1 Tax=Bifidobacterium choloepi TaxID=2614131 RepID=A0A6I5N2E1_9BIFI|nr:lipopolysaccharide biosynthesis protein [Bifidobacterium choloepi]NEG70345.1 lipopolysaccharide biosynthesis protein [Bifidobacterium choloepi]
MKRNETVSPKKAAVIQFVAKYATIVIQLVLTAILARLLTPDQFGEVAIVTVFTSFFNIFSDMGVGAAIIQFRQLEQKDFEKLFAFSIVLSTVLTIVFAMMSYPFALFYSDMGLIPLFLAATPTLFFNTLNMVPNGLMLRGKRFKAIGLRLIVTTLISGVVAVFSAALGMGAYALILQTGLSAFSVFIWNFLSLSVRKPNFHFVEPLKLIFSYSSFQFGFSTINYFSRNLDNLLIGKFFGDVQLGYYDKAYKLTTYPLSSFTSVVSSIVQPFMAEHQDHKKIIWDFWFRIEKLVSLVGAVITAIFVACSREVVLLFYGSQWSASIPLFTLLAFSVYFQMLGNTSGAFFQSLGRTDLQFRVGLINTVVTVGCLVLGLCTGKMLYVAALIAAAYIIQIFTTFFYLIKRAFGGTFSVVVRFIPEIIIAAVAVVVAIFTGSLINGGLILQFSIKMLLVCSIMFIGYLLFGQLKYLLAIIKRKK